MQRSQDGDYKYAIQQLAEELADRAGFDFWSISPKRQEAFYEEAYRQYTENA